MIGPDRLSGRAKSVGQALMVEGQETLQGRTAFDVDHHRVQYVSLFRWFYTVLGPESSYYWMTIIYGIGISLLTLALPISVQMLIDTVANTALWQPVVVLATVLFALLLLSGLLVALRIHVMELFGRRIYSRLTAEIALRAVHAQVPYFLEGKRDSLFNRFFDIMILQTNVPSLLTGAFSLLLQSVIGFVVVSLYHPYLLIFTVFIVLSIFLIWLIWGPGAIRTAIEESYAKYDTAQVLEGLAENNDYYRNGIRLRDAMDKTNQKTAYYIVSNRRLFRYSFSQQVSFLILYAVGSALLLGIGGWLVIQGQLTLGQLVAAELILSAILLGISQSGFYLDQFYEVCAAVDKLSAFFRIPLEEEVGSKDAPKIPCRIEFDQVITERRDGERIELNFDIPAASSVIVPVSQVTAQRAFLALLQAYERPLNGWVRLGGMDLRDIEPSRLRANVMVFDRTDIVETTIDEYLSLANPDASSAAKVQALKDAGLDATVHRLSKGTKTEIVPTGWPLSPSETLRLKLAGALLRRPRVVVLTEIFDLVERRYLNPVLDNLSQDMDTTLIRFTDDEPRPWATHSMILRGGHQTLERLDWGGQES